MPQRAYFSRFLTLFVLILFCLPPILTSGSHLVLAMEEDSEHLSLETTPSQEDNTDTNQATVEESSQETSLEESSTQAENHDSKVQAVQESGLQHSETSRIDSGYVAILPLDAKGDIQLNTSQQSNAQIALLGEDGQVTITSPTEQNRYIPKNKQAAQQVQQVLGSFAQVSYDDAYTFLQPRERSFDRLAITTELRKQLGRQPSPEEITTSLRRYYLDKLDMREAFTNVQHNLDSLLTAVFERSEQVDIQRIEQHKLQILLGLTYLERQYSFQFNGISAKHLLLLHPEFIGGVNSSAIERLIQLGQVSYIDLELGNANQTFSKKLAPYTSDTGLQNWLDRMVAMFVPQLEPANWFTQTSHAVILETNSLRADTRIYEKMRYNPRLARQLIALLTVSPDSVYAISTMSSVTYGAVGTYMDAAQVGSGEKFQTQLQKIAQQQEQFFDTWYRITDKKDELLASSIIVIDSLQALGQPGQSARTLWSPSTGEKALRGVREFITPLNFYRSYFQVAAEASTSSQSFSYFIHKALTQEGQETFTHEVTHLLDKTVWFNGLGTRTGQGPEVFARGLFESQDVSIGASSYKPIFNLNFAYELGDSRVQNASPSRFETEADLQTYMQGVLDVIYTLDYAEAKASLTKPASDKALLYYQMSLIPDNNPRRASNQVKDSIQVISPEQAETLHTVHDLIAQGMISSRFTFQGIKATGTVEPNGYYTIPLFQPIYAALQNNAGSVGDISFRRNAYDLLGEYGYKNGMVAYLSNQYGGTDQAALTAILAGEFNGNLVSFKQGMFQRRIDQANRLKPITGFANFNEIEQAMIQAVEEDLAKMKINQKNQRPLAEGVSAVDNLKLHIFQSYLQETNDFRNSIYQPLMSQVTEEELLPIPITDNHQDDPTLWEGETRITPGTEGQKKISRTWQTEDGVKIGQPTVTETVLQDMKPRIVYHGKKPVHGQKTWTETLPIPISSEERVDPQLEIGKIRIVEGFPGKKVITYTQKTFKGQPVGQPTTTEVIKTPMKKKIIYKGSKPTPTYKVSYQFISQDSNKKLPKEVSQLLPNDTKTYSSGQVIVAKQPSTKAITLADGSWTFVGYDKEKISIENDNIRFVGRWAFTPKPDPKPDPKPNPKPNPKP
ncbi:ZmpA/ZmpB/ZmpC family metallo-endopeptidase, partial [Streptococcus minor]|uniref:ZmpA/ZmpB/ZmpC family metallo-endopeptidase n=1 Tax=Streptococcus minor TaxID=229549 RepID=UPI00037D5A65